ncbi:MAG: hypothetical protein U0792_24770 [Gemmataceae bacterium]
MWAPDGRKMYCPEMGSKHAGGTSSSNLGPGKYTCRGGGFHAADSARGHYRSPARISFNGEWIVYECGADLWVVGTKLGSPPCSFSPHRGERRRQVEH